MIDTIMLGKICAFTIAFSLESTQAPCG